MIRLARTITLVLLAVSLSVAAKKERAWQEGRVLDTERQRYFTGVVNDSNTSSTGHTSGNSTAVYAVYEEFVIEGNQYVYHARERLRWRWSNPAVVTVNGPIKYVVEKKKIIVLDEEGKEHEMEIIKKVLRQQ